MRMLYLSICRWVFIPAATAFLPVTAIRSTLLLCSLEITKDLATAEAIRTRTSNLRSCARAVHSPNPNNNDDTNHPSITTIGWGTTSINAKRNEWFVPSWWTQHRRYLRNNKYLHRLIGLLVLAHIISDIGTAPLLNDSPDFTSTCSTQRQLLFRYYNIMCLGIIQIPQVLLIMVVTWNLRRHSHGIHLYSRLNE
jgi:hypothetical protein